MYIVFCITFSFAYYNLYYMIYQIMFFLITKLSLFYSYKTQSFSLLQPIMLLFCHSFISSYFFTFSLKTVPFRLFFSCRKFILFFRIYSNFLFFLFSFCFYKIHNKTFLFNFSVNLLCSFRKFSILSFQ